MPRLIVNADDLGAGTLRDRGIFQSFAQGIVTSASLLANGPSFVTAVQGARDHGLPLGVHLNLSEGVPLNGALPGLTLSSGTFPGKSGLRRTLGGKIAADLLHAELATQIERVLAAGVVPDHLDTHQHCCLFPVITEIVLALAQEYAIPALRLSAPAEPPAADPDGELGAELALYRRLAPACAARIRARGLATPDGLFGMPLLDRLDRQSLLATLAALPAGSWELMVHPGYCDATVPFGGAERQCELDALTDPECGAALHRHGIELISFRELACAS